MSYDYVLRIFDLPKVAHFIFKGTILHLNFIFVGDLERTLVCHIFFTGFLPLDPGRGIMPPWLVFAPNI